MFKTFLVALLPALAHSSVFGNTAFKLDGNPICSDGLEVEINTLTCVDEEGGTDGVCDLGESAEVYGLLTIGNAGLPETAVVINKVCVMGLDWGDLTCRTQKFEVDLCTFLGFNREYESCPTVGTYSFHSSFDIPGTGHMSLYHGTYSAVREGDSR